MLGMVTANILRRSDWDSVEKMCRGETKSHDWKGAALFSKLTLFKNVAESEFFSAIFPNFFPFFIANVLALLN